jgi:hypothetical protein
LILEKKKRKSHLDEAGHSNLMASLEKILDDPHVHDPNQHSMDLEMRNQRLMPTKDHFVA